MCGFYVWFLCLVLINVWLCVDLMYVFVSTRVCVCMCMCMYVGSYVGSYGLFVLCGHFVGIFGDISVYFVLLSFYDPSIRRKISI